MKVLNTVNLKEDLDDILFSSECIVVWNNYIVLVSIYENSIFLLNKDEYSLDKMIEINGTKGLYNAFQYFSIYNDRLILIPYSAKNFMEIDLNTGKQSVLADELSEQQQMIDNKFITGFIDKQFLWCIGAGIHSINCYDLEHKFKKVVEFTYPEEIAWSDSYANAGGDVLIPSLNSNKLLRINVLTKEVDVKVLKGMGEKPQMLSIASFENKVHLFDNKGKEYLLQLDTFEVVEVKNVKNFVSRDNYIHDKSLYRLGLYDHYIYIRNLCNQKEKMIPIKLKGNFGNITHFHHGRFIENSFYFQSRYGQLFKVDLKQNTVEDVCIKKNVQYKEKIEVFWKEILHKEVLPESYAGVFLTDYIDLIQEEML